MANVDDEAVPKVGGGAGKAKGAEVASVYDEKADPSKNINAASKFKANQLCPYGNSCTQQGCPYPQHMGQNQAEAASIKQFMQAQNPSGLQVSGKKTLKAPK